MITLAVDLYTPISQNFYDNLIASLQFNHLTCTCSHSNCLTIHGYYLRKLKQGDDSIGLSICRVKCSICGKTHALLPASIVPYSQISLPDQAEIILSFENNISAVSVMERNPSIDENNVASVLLRYKQYWRQHLISEHIPIIPLSELTSRCFDAFNKQFMQIRRTPNFLFTNTT